MVLKQQHWSKKVLAVFIGAIAVKSTSIIAEETTSQELETVQVLGAEEEGFNVAMTADMIEKRQASDLEDLLRHEPSIMVGGGLPVAQKIYVRGLEDTLMNVTIDGAAQTGYLYHHQGRINVESELIKEVVVKAGAGNATDGAGALGGAIHFKLKDAQDMLRDGEKSGALVKGSYFSNSGALKAHASAYAMLNDDFGLLASFTNLESSDDYEDGNGNEIPETEVEQRDIRLKLSGNLSKDSYLSLSYEEYEDDGVRYARPNMIDIGFHPIYPSPAVPQETHRESAIINFAYSPEDAHIDLETTLYYNDNYLTKQGDLFTTWPPGSGFTDYYNGQKHGGGVESIGFDIRNTIRLSRSDFTFGVEYREDEGYLINPVTNFQNEDVKVMALYAQADHAINDIVSVSTGLRYDNYDYVDNNGLEFRDDGVSPNLTVSIEVSDELEVHAGAAKAFKGATTPEVWFLEFPPLASTMVNYQGPNFDNNGFLVGTVESEESLNKEVGFKYESQNFAASGEIYRQTIENALVTGSTQRYSYVDDVTVDGYALRGAYYLPSITLNAGVAKSSPKLAGEPLSSGDMGLGTAYGRTWTTGLEYEFDDSITFGWNARFVERLEDVREGQDEKAGYGIHDFYVQWLPLTDLTVGLAINNVLDKFFYDQGTFYTRNDSTAPYGLPEPGRDIRVALAYQF